MKAKKRCMKATFIEIHSSLVPRSHGVTVLAGVPAGVMSLDFHPQQANILALGLHSGNIEVHNTMGKDAARPLFKTSAAAGKHDGAVTALRCTAVHHI